MLAEFRALRKSMGLTQRAAAAIVGLKPSTISVYECGQGNVSDIRIRQLIEKLRQARTETPLYTHVAVVDEPAFRGAWNDRFIGPHPKYVPAPPRTTPKLKARTVPLPRGAPDENELCLCGSVRSRHDGLRYSCMDCRKGASACQFFRTAKAMAGAR